MTADTQKKKLTKLVVDGLPTPAAGQTFFWDSELKGFGVRVTPGSKTYVVQARVNSKTVRVTLGSHGELTAEEARKEARKRLGSMASGTNPNQVKAEQRAKSVTLQEVFNEYKNSKSNLRATTVAGYCGVMRRCFADWLDKPITNISKDMVQKKHLALSQANGPRGTGAAQANQAMRVLRLLFNFAIDRYEGTDSKPVSDNPVKRLSQAKVWNRVPRRQGVIKNTDLAKWYETVMSLDEGDKRMRVKNTMRDYLLLCLFTGLRRNEAARLRWKDVDLKASTLRITAEGAKNHQEHVLPLSTFLHQLLHQRFTERRLDNSYVFPGERGDGHLIESKWSVSKVSENSGVKFMIHDLRRTFITIGESVDIPAYSLKKLINHKTNADVTAGYIVTDVERLREPMQRICDCILKHATAKPESEKTTDEADVAVSGN